MIKEKLQVYNNKNISLEGRWAAVYINTSNNTTISCELKFGIYWQNHGRQAGYLYHKISSRSEYKYRVMEHN